MYPLLPFLRRLFRKARPAPIIESRPLPTVPPVLDSDMEAAREAERADQFREALANGEITGDIVAVDEQGRAVQRETSNIFDS